MLSGASILVKEQKPIIGFGLMQGGGGEVAGGLKLLTR